MSAVVADLRLRSTWRLALPAVLLLWASVLLLYRDTATAMVGIWSRSDTFAHAYLVLPISIWLVWRRRDVLARMTPRPQPWLLVPMAVVAGMWLLADLVTVNAATQFALVAMLVMAVPAMLGLAVAKAILFPLLFLFFAVPFGEFLLPMLMEHTADFTVAALRLSGVPVYREGLRFVIPTGSWSVVEACSGVRYLIASFMVGTLFAYLNYRSTTRRVVFMAVSIVVPIVANWLRAYMIVMLGHLSGNTIAVGVDHLIYGWVFFGVVIMILYLIGARWAEPDAAPAAATAAQPGEAGHTASGGAFAAVLLASVALLALPQWTSATLQRANAGAAPPVLVLPDRLGDWRAEAADAVPWPWRPGFVNPSAEVQRAYTLDGRTVGVYIAYYRSQGPDRKLVSSQNVLVGSKDLQWRQVAIGSTNLAVAGRPLQVRTADLASSPVGAAAQRPGLRVWQTFWVDGAWVAGDAAGKLRGALGQLAGRGDDGAVLVLFTHAHADANPNARDPLAAFAQAHLGDLERLLREVRDAR